MWPAGITPLDLTTGSDMRVRLAPSFFLGDSARVFLEIDTTLSHQPWLAGDALSLADISHVVYVARMDTFQLSGLYEPLPHLVDWLTRIRARPSWAEAVVKWGDTSSPARVKHGREAYPKVKTIWDAA